MKKRILFAAGVVMFCAFCAQAQLIYVGIEGTVYAVRDDNNDLEGNISIGTKISGYYCYESTTTDSSPVDVVQGNYWHYNSPHGMFLSVGGFNFETDPNNVEFQVFIRNNNTSGNDIYGVGSSNNLILSNGVTVSQMFWQLEDSSMAVLFSDALPTTAPVPDDWDDNMLMITGGGPKGNDFAFSAQITDAEIVPEPVTIILMSLGALALRKRRQ